MQHPEGAGTGGEAPPTPSSQSAVKNGIVGLMQAKFVGVPITMWATGIAIVSAISIGLSMQKDG